METFLANVSAGDLFLAILLALWIAGGIDLIWGYLKEKNSEQARREIQERADIIRQIKNAPAILVLYGNPVSPYRSEIVLHLDDRKSISVYEFFKELEILEKLPMIYEVEKTRPARNASTVFSGKFANDGRQKLTDVLGKEVLFVYCPRSQPGKVPELSHARFSPIGMLATD